MIVSSISLFALSINECKTDIYFGNGVWNSLEDAETSVDILSEVIQREIIKDNPKLQAKYGEVKLQYNWGGGAMQDVLETYYQLKKEGQVNDLEFFMVMMIITRGNKELSTYATSVMLESMPFVAQIEQKNVDNMLQKYYKESFKLSHRVLLISHSQGNLFANRVYDSISPSGYQNYFANVQVASPASSVHASHGTYITGFVDPIINPIPGSMESNANLNFPGGHAFVEAYLDSDDTYSKIVDAIKTQLDVLNTIDSQWKTEQELKKGTKDYRITVKHKFDTTITTMQDMKVYPFNTAKKLYQVNGKYVKASCGGTKILDADKDDGENKKENEFYYLEGTGEIIKGGKCEFRVQLNDNDLAVYDKDTFFTVGRTYNQPYSSYKFNISYDNETKTYTASRHKTTTWVNSCGDKLQIGNGAGGRWIHRGLNLSVQIAK